MKLESYNKEIARLALVAENKEDCAILLIISRKYPNLFDLKVQHGGISYYANPRMYLVFTFPQGDSSGAIKMNTTDSSFLDYSGGNTATFVDVGVDNKTGNAEEITEKGGSISPSPTKDEERGDIDIPTGLDTKSKSVG